MIFFGFSITKISNLCQIFQALLLNSCPTSIPESRVSNFLTKPLYILRSIRKADCAHWFEWGNTVHQIVAMPYIFTIDLKLVNFNRKRLFEGFNNIKAAARSYQGYMKVKTTEAQTKFNFWHIFASVNAKWVVYTLKSLIICS